MCMDCCLKPYGTFQKKKKNKKLLHDIFHMFRSNEEQIHGLIENH